MACEVPCGAEIAGLGNSLCIGAKSMNKTGLATLICVCLAGSAAFALRAPERRSDPCLTSSSAQVEVRREPMQSQRFAALQLQGANVQWDDRTGAPASIRGETLVPAGRRLGNSKDFEQNALAVLKDLSAVYRMKDALNELSVKRTSTDSMNYHHVRVKQTFGGLRVIGAELIVHFNEQDTPYQVNGRYFPDLATDKQPAITPAQATVAAEADLAAGNRTGASMEGKPELVIYALTGTPCLAYELRFKLATHGYWITWVNAATGSMIGGYSDLKTLDAAASRADVSINGYILENEGGTNVTVTGSYDGSYLRYLLYNNVCVVVNMDTTGAYPDSYGYAYRYTLNWGTSDRTEMSAARNFALIQSYYKTEHIRNSYDNLGTRLWVNVHLTDVIDNAFWDERNGMVFIGTASETNMAGLAVLDICAHEYTHALTQYTADLIYQGESGALNESFSDIFATAIEFTYQPDGRHLYPYKLPATADWLIGEDAMLQNVAMRDMSNPASTKTLNNWDRQASRYQGTLWYAGSDDNGGVHYNCGVQNFFFYLLSDGGAGVNDGIPYAVQGIGIKNAAKIAFRTLVNYCTEYTDYKLAYYAWISAAQDLNPSWKASVQAAWSAVGIKPEGGSDVWDPTDDNVSGASMLCMVNSERIHAQHTLSGGDKYDYFIAYLYSGVRYNFNTTGGAGDTFGELYDSALLNNRVAYDDNSGGNQMFSFDYTPSGSGWYFLRVRTPSLGGYALYTLQYQGYGMAPGARALLNDFNGNGVSDLAAVDGSNATWYVRNISGSNIVVGNICSGMPDLVPLSGDFDGDRASELVEYDMRSGAWYVCTANGSYYAHGTLWGAPWMWPCPADYDGDGLCDFAVYDWTTGHWFISRLDTTILAWDRPWGYPGAVPVVGDYNGDGASDLAVYDYSSGNWYIQTLAGTILAWNMAWGYPAENLHAIPGDYDGDGASDLALFDESTGKWYIRTVAGTVLAWGLDWGSRGLMPVPGDYNGDGKYDLALYYPYYGRWYIRSVDGYILAWDVELGGNGMFPVNIQ